ncbi:hypothetical protein C4D60_Mb11t18580 [Musa balbisiana]|uniref:Uncharacterized protein n=1 Tax=Musa balbisiana TaxID=52838 RepID=A0A4V4H5L7_MUSBA|nr:hypothetical protein C4D60_Mb11t18580 [Musa balbisiana]
MKTAWRTLGTLNPIKIKGVQHPSIIPNQRPAGPKEVLQPRVKEEDKEKRRNYCWFFFPNCHNLVFLEPDNFPAESSNIRRRGEEEESLDNLSPAVAETSKQGSSFSLLQNSAIENHHKPTASSLSSTSKDEVATTTKSTSSAVPNKVHQDHEKLTEKPGLGSILGSLADALNTIFKLRR